MNVKEIRNSIQSRLAHNVEFRSVNYLCVRQSPVTLRKQNRNTKSEIEILPILCLPVIPIH